MSTKTATKRAGYQIAEFKAVGVLGEFTALVSVFGNVDLAGDRVVKGAFDGDLARWKASGDPIPVIFSHQWDDPFAHIGFVTSAVETAAGLLIGGKLDIDKPFAKQVFDLLVARRIKEWSFAYDIFREQRAKDGANELLELGLIEVGPTLKGCNPDTETIAAKALADAGERDKDGAHVERINALSGRKVYLDAEIPGSFDEVEDSVRTAAQSLLNPTDDENVYVWVQATFPDYAIVQICRAGEDDQNFQIPWTRDGDDAVTLGEPVEVDVSVAITPKSAKAGRTISQATATELKSISDDLSAAHDMYGKALDRMGALCSSATAADAGKHIEDPQADDDREPQAKSDPEWLALRTRVEKMRATTQETP